MKQKVDLSLKNQLSKGGQSLESYNKVTEHFEPFEPRDSSSQRRINNTKTYIKKKRPSKNFLKKRNKTVVMNDTLEPVQVLPIF